MKATTTEAYAEAAAATVASITDKKRTLEHH